MKTITIFNRKGGSGKTALTILSGAYLAAAGKRVLLVDLDPQASLTAYFERVHDFDVAGPGVYEILSGRIKDDGAITHFLDRISLLHATGSLSSLEGSASVMSLKKFLDGVLEDFDFCLIDTPGNWSLLVQTALLASDECLVPSLVATDDMENAIWSCERAEEQDAPGRIIMNQWRGTKANRETVDLFGDDTAGILLESRIPYSPLVNRYTDAGEKLTDARQKKEFLEAISHYAKEAFGVEEVVAGF